MKAARLRVAAHRLGLVLALVVLLACELPSLVAEPTMVPPTATRTATPPPLTPSPSSTPVPTFTATPQPTATPEIPLDPQLDRDGVDLFPWPLYPGDHLSIDVDPVLLNGAGEETTVSVQLHTGDVYTSPVRPMGFNGEPQARFYWLTELPEVEQTALMTVTLNLSPEITDTNPANNALVISVPLQPRDLLPPPEPGARWAMTETTGFRLHYITESAANRDLLAIMETAGEAYEMIAARLGEPQEPVDIYLLDRVIGQGGYASSEWVAVSYPDRHYAPVELGSVIRHELVHRLDEALECDDAPAAMREGLAVYLAGGHYRTESLRDKASVLLGSPRRIPLDEMVVDFYTHQHEVAYLQAGAVIQYLVEHYGWEVLEPMCEAASEQEGDESEKWDAALDAVEIDDGRELETAWESWLADGNADAEDERLLELELRLMETMRAYQAAYDPAAHYVEGLLFSPEEAAEREIVADFVRRPREPEAVAMELVLAMAQEAVDQSEAEFLASLLEELNKALTQDVTSSNLMRDVRQITTLAMAEGYEPYRLELENSDDYLLYVLDYSEWPQQRLIPVNREASVWSLSDGREGQ